MQLYQHTPLLESQSLSLHLGKPVYLKMEALQPSGSFKNRGMARLCSYSAQQGAKGFVASSGGNAGLAVAYAGRLLGLPVKVFVPEGTRPMVLEKLRQELAEVLIFGKVWDETDRMARQTAEEIGYAYIPPFDHPLLWEGHASMIEEVAQSGIKPGAVLVSVGGGGMLCGVLEGLHKVGWKNVPVVAVETEGAASYHAALQAGHPVTLDKIDTIASSLGAKRVAEEAVFWAKKHTIHSCLVSDKQAVSACLRFADDHRILVEPACGATLALIYDKASILESFSTVLAIVCGGNCVSLALLEQWKKQFFL
ncbi:MAG: pyridoxal-phosphate dependent enzyme [Parachlamydia sp.]|nr:pyridoxal-phosphate dependent enzyme [Parachlamydia sp.]